jgi:hypothetical protein
MITASILDLAKVAENPCHFGKNVTNVELLAISS